MKDDNTTDSQRTAELVTKEQAYVADEKEFHQQLNQDLESNVQLGPANVEQKGYWLYDIVIHGFNKRSGMGKILYIVVIVGIFILGYWLFSQLTS